MSDRPDNMPPLYIHVGLHKTGTTFLQEEVFPKLTSVDFLRSQRIVEMLQRFAAEEDSCFDLSTYQRFFEPIINPCPSLISHEGLSGHNYLLYMNQTRNADRLAKLFPHASIILGIRRQDSLLLSLYVHFIKGGASVRLDDFLGYQKGEFQNRYDAVLGNHVNMPMFNYDHIANLYGDRFDGRVHFLVYEQLTRDVDGFVRNFCQLVGEPEVPSVQNVRHNTSYGRYQYILARALNRFFVSPRNPDGLIPGFWWPGHGLRHFNRFLDHKWVHSIFNGWYGNKVTMPEKVSKAIMEYFSPSNAVFEQKWGLSLREQGYVLDTPVPVDERSGEAVGQQVEKTLP